MKTATKVVLGMVLAAIVTVSAGCFCGDLCGGMCEPGTPCSPCERMESDCGSCK